MRVRRNFAFPNPWFAIAVALLRQTYGVQFDIGAASPNSRIQPNDEPRLLAYASRGGFNDVKDDFNIREAQRFRHDNPFRSQSTLSDTTSSHSQRDGSESWGYAEDNGPLRWKQACRDGLRQSPVDFRARDIDYTLINEMQFVGYDTSGAVNVKNTGHGVQVDGFDRWRLQDRPYIYGGGLNGRYILSQFHFHWSYGHDDGSEHTVASLHYPVEMHLVHLKEGYTPTEMTSKTDGIAVIGVFMTLSENGTSWTTLNSALRKVTYKGENTRIFNYTMGVNLPENTQNFYRYTGSLTTPGCNEIVIWTVLAEPVGITDAQLKILRSVKIGSRHTLPDSNARPTQPLNGRRIQYRSGTANPERCSSDSVMRAHEPSVVDTITSFFNIRISSNGSVKLGLPKNLTIALYTCCLLLNLASSMYYIS